MTREEALALIKQQIIARQQPVLDDYEDDPREAEELAALQALNAQVTAATNLSEIAVCCQKMAWDISSFVGLLLEVFGFEEQDMDHKWLNEHGYGWDT